MITNFFKRKSGSVDDEVSVPKKADIDKAVPQPPVVAKPVTCQLKTVKKWMRELNTNVGYRLQVDEQGKETDIVCEIWCSVCREFAKTSDRCSSLVSGSTRVKKEAIIQHLASECHAKAKGTKTAKTLAEQNQSPPLETAFQKCDEQLLVKMDKLFRSAYYLVSKERPFTDFPDILNLQSLNGLSLGDTYRNDKAAKSFVAEIANYYEDDLKKLLQQADYFSLFCDGSTDKSQTEKELIMVKVMDNHYPKIKFLKLEEPQNTKATGILAAIDKAFDDFGFPEYKKKLIGFCSDGANVMLGERQGVIHLLKDQGNAEWILSVWCLAHRLELAVKDAFKQTYMNTIIDVLQLIYYFYKGSAKRNKEANDIADLMDEHFMKPAQANGTRWVEHKLQAVSKLILNWKVIIIHLMNYAEDRANRADYCAKAKGIIAKIREYKFVWYLYFVNDVLSEVAKVSLLFQREDINVSSSVTKIQSALLSLRDMMNNPGPQLQEFSQDVVGDQYKDHTLLHVVNQATLNQQKNAILQDIIDCIERRFGNLTEDEIYLACNVFDHKNWPDDRTALQQYGVDDVKVIYNHFRTLLNSTPGGCDPTAALREWSELKVHVSRNPHFKNVHPLAIWERISQEDGTVNDISNYSNIFKIIHLTSLYPLSNASCERGFSTMKRIKSDWRCNLSNDTMDMLMRIDIEGPQLNDFTPRPIVLRWWVSGQRIKRPNTLPYGPHQ